MTLRVALLHIGCLLAALVRFNSCADPSGPPQKLGNIDFLGQSYDILYGNPHGDLSDPGFKVRPVINLSYDSNTWTADGKRLLPDYVESLQYDSCSFAVQSTEITGMESYLQSLSVDVKLEGLPISGIAMFSGSFDYKNLNNKTLKDHRIFIESVAKQLQFEAAVQTGARLHSGFVDEVTRLPLDYDEDDYLRFISFYGTHYSSKVRMGAKAVIRSEFDEVKMSEMHEKGWDLNLAAAGSFGGSRTSCGIIGIHVNETLTKEYESRRKSFKRMHLGCEATADGQLITSPYPIEYTLRPLTELLDSRYIQDMKEIDLKAIRINLEQAVKKYTGDGSMLPTPDRTLTQMKSSESTVKGLQTISCPPEHSLLSCSMRYNASEAQSYRFAHPSERQKDTCVCFSKLAAQCIPWCTKSTIELEVTLSSRIKARSQDDRVKTTAICPLGSRVIGCHINSSRLYENRNEYYTGYYPKDDQSGCVCSYYYDAETSCVASCSRQVRADRHEIRKNYGVGFITVTCSESNFVMGCGVNPADGNNAWYRTAWVDSINSCKCYDEKGATCYAICGQFNSSTERSWLRGRWVQEQIERDGWTSRSSKASVTTDLVVRPIRGFQNVSCRAGMSLMSCGMGNMDGVDSTSHFNTNFEKFRHAYPVNSTTCQCYDYFGAMCFAWCSNAVQGFETVKVTIGSTNVTSATCPYGKKVIGCHVIPFQRVPYHKLLSFYPNENGTSCLCHASDLSTCVASCASNVGSYEVIEKPFNIIKKLFYKILGIDHEIKARCSSPEKYVLGCGTEMLGLLDDDLTGSYLTVHVTPSTSCTCFDRDAAKCYAICGTFGQQEGYQDTFGRQYEDLDDWSFYQETVKLTSHSQVKQRNRVQRILGGTPAVEKEFPSVVSVQLLENGQYEHICGATIIHDSWVLTAAHCLYDQKKQTLRVVAGDLSHDAEREQVHRVTNFFWHEQYDKETFKNDIALLEVDKAFDFSDARVAMAKLPTKSKKFTGSCTVAGWGDTSYKGTPSPDLLKVEIPLVSDLRCAQAHKYFDATSMMCAGEDGKDACQDDSGGPLYCDGFLAGVVSFGVECGNPDFPGVYTKVSHFVDWINNKIRLKSQQNTSP
ncbi:unnamed protein product [Darwinula stevensoni]|uniref:Uncharacterized protein n=1 Tax=Darwinula stevensoni TaxID=69355 RepID=A0A7R9A8S9_9CRUS|nr:unnamed protein product [Darwinula stevensoni]CAG0896757.1 unnamed protein product [Darwinula stevensoni]